MMQSWKMWTCGARLPQVADAWGLLGVPAWGGAEVIESEGKRARFSRRSDHFWGNIEL